MELAMNEYHKNEFETLIRNIRKYRGKSYGWWFTDVFEEDLEMLKERPDYLDKLKALLSVLTNIANCGSLHKLPSIYEDNEEIELRNVGNGLILYFKRNAPLPQNVNKKIEFLALLAPNV